MIITKDKIYNNSTVKLDATNSTLMDVGTESAMSRDETIYLDFITNQLPTTLHVQLIDTASNTTHFTKEGLAFCEINLQTATLQESSPNRWGDKYRYNDALSSCSNRYDNHWPKVFDEGLAIVKSYGGYHIYYVLHNPVHHSGFNWKFGSGYIVYDNNVSEIYMTDHTRIDKSLKIGSKIQIDANGLQNIGSPTEQNTFNFWNEDNIHYNSQRIALVGTRHDEWGIDDYFTFTDTLSSEQKNFLIPTASIKITYEDWYSSIKSDGQIDRVTSGTKNAAMDTSAWNEVPFEVECTFKNGIITKIQMPNIDGGNLTNTCTVTYTTQKISQVIIPLLYSGTLYFHSSKTQSELWEYGKTYSFQDNSGELWYAKWDSSYYITLTPENKELSYAYKPTFSVFYSIIRPDANMIPILSPIQLTANYHEGKFERGAIVAVGETIKYCPKDSETTGPVLILAYVDINE